MIDHGDRWSLGGDDLTVTRISFDWGMTLTIGSTEPQIDVRIEQPFELTDSDGSSVRLVPEGDPSAMAPVLGINRRSVERMDAFSDGRLEIVISDGIVVRVESSERCTRHGRSQVPADSDSSQWQVVDWRYGRRQAPDELMAGRPASPWSGRGGCCQRVAVGSVHCGFE
jgi:Family of unknown function (DUF6188)